MEQKHVDYNYDINSNGEVQYGAYFLMRWLGGIGGDKTGGGWIDVLGTTPNTYLEQARQTVLAGAKEIMLHGYGILNQETNNYFGWAGTGIADLEALKKEIPDLYDLAEFVRNKPVRGIHMPKPPDSDPFEEPYIYSILGMLGLPLVPAHEIDKNSESAIFPVHVLKKPGFSAILQNLLNNGSQVVITDGLAKRLNNQVLLGHKNLSVLNVEGDPKKLVKQKKAELYPIRTKLLSPLGIRFDAPNKVGFYLFGDNHLVVENFNDQTIDVGIDFPSVSFVRKVIILPGQSNGQLSVENNKIRIRFLSPRSLIAVEYR